MYSCSASYAQGNVGDEVEDQQADLEEGHARILDRLELRLRDPEKPRVHPIYPVAREHKPQSPCQQDTEVDHGTPAKGCTDCFKRHHGHFSFVVPNIILALTGFNRKFTSCMNNETIIRKASFNPKVCTYWILSHSLVLILIVVGIPFLLLWIPLSLYFTKRYLDRMECILTERDLKVNKGLFVRVEKTIPLEKITDLGMVQGPIMRRFGLHQLNVETAGHSSEGSLVSLTGIVDVEGFREAVLNQRDQIREPGKAASAKEQAPKGDSEILREINATLVRIEEQLKKG